MKPIGIFIFSLFVIITLTVLALIFPEDGFKINDELTLNFYTYPSNKDSLKAEKPLYQVLEEQIDIDTLADIPLSDSIIVVPIRKDSLLKNVQRIVFGAGGRLALQKFFQSAINAKRKGELVRVMHYGDSQIEGDRITSYLRTKIQKKFGGYGVGMVPVLHVADFSFPIKQKAVGKWKRYTLFGRKNPRVLHNEYGVLHNFSRFTPILPDTIACDSLLSTAGVTFTKSPIAYSNTRTFQKVKVFVKNRRCGSTMAFKQGDALLKTVQLDTSKYVQYDSYSFAGPVENCEISFQSYDSPDILGIALDPVAGLVVDNIALRGSSGDVFTKANWNTLNAMYHRLDVKLFILQFGGNKVPFIEDVAAAKRYGRYFQSQIRTLQKMCPDAAIIVIGPADMSKKDKEQFVSYEMLVPVRDALRDAAINSGAGFWDMLSAMGGVNSMPGWVAASPALANDDHIHFTTKGAKVVAQMFYNALIMEYNAMKHNARPDSEIKSKKENETVVKK